MFIRGLPKMEKQKNLPFCLQASLPVQEYLFMPFDQSHKQYETARHLPPPLYVLFVQATAYGQACGEYWGLVKKRGYGSNSHGWLNHLEALLAEESSQALLRSPEVTNAASPLHPSMAALTSWPEAGLTWWAFQNGWLWNFDEPGWLALGCSAGSPRHAWQVDWHLLLCFKEKAWWT